MNKEYFQGVTDALLFAIAAYFLMDFFTKLGKKHATPVYELTPDAANAIDEVIKFGRELRPVAVPVQAPVITPQKPLDPARTQ